MSEPKPAILKEPAVGKAPNVIPGMFYLCLQLSSGLESVQNTGTHSSYAAAEQEAIRFAEKGMKIVIVEAVAIIWTGNPAVYVWNAEEASRDE